MAQGFYQLKVRLNLYPSQPLYSNPCLVYVQAWTHFLHLVDVRATKQILTEENVPIFNLHSRSIIITFNVFNVPWTMTCSSGHYTHLAIRG